MILFFCSRLVLIFISVFATMRIQNVFIIVVIIFVIVDEKHRPTSQCSMAVLTVVRSTNQSYKDSKILGGQNSKTPEPTDKKFGIDDYVGDDSPHAKNYNDCPIGGMAVYV